MSHCPGSLPMQPWTQHLQGSCQAVTLLPAQARPVAQDMGHARVSPWPVSPASCPAPTTCLTIDKNSEAQEVQVALTATRVPANVWVPFGQEHGAALEATASQVGHHLGVESGAQSEARPTLTTFFPCSSLELRNRIYLWLPRQTVSLTVHTHHLLPSSLTTRPSLSLLRSH